MPQTAIVIFTLVFFGWILTAQAAPTKKDEKTVQHVIGTITIIDAKHIVVKTAKGLLVSAKLTKDVQFKNKQHPRSNDPPAVGDHVIIEATKQNKVLTATVIHYSPMGQTPAPPQ